MTFSIHTLGCKVNWYESAALSGVFIKNGAVLVSEDEKCDVFCINTCAVTEESVRKSRQMIRRARRKNPDAVIAVCGCASQTEPDFASKLPEADIVIGNKEKTRIYEYVCQFLQTRERIVNIPEMDKEKCFENMNSERIGTTRAALKVQDGCNNFCSYCIIPYARGRIRSRDIDDAVREAESLVAGGCREIVLAGIHIDNYGKDIGTYDLTDLLLRLGEIPDLIRVRLGSLEPVFVTEKNIEKIKNIKNLCHQFHLSLQSGCEKTLKAMNRHYTPDEFAAAADLLRRTFPDCSITTDIITGFPGETEEDFLQSLDFAVRMKFAKVHVFPYSERRGTRAASMDGKLPKDVKEDRCRRMIKACAPNEAEFYENLVGKEKYVLFETEKNGIFTGYTPEYAEIRVKCERDIRNLIFPVIILAGHENYAEGEVILS
ncbi:MAG: tRNA (N(6)-L-threonylcarbamoyladenosine(37)-C(2))-methylthiotransferase MtaB [Clostridia bacterium]|nr:tRNA (N(6)-L-threonylcarbamoyladenosine(37)-C(2))-methylthiotransferase MtaB [Clostridia bacterium]